MNTNFREFTLKKFISLFFLLNFFNGFHLNLWSLQRLNKFYKAISLKNFTSVSCRIVSFLKIGISSYFRFNSSFKNFRTVFLPFCLNQRFDFVWAPSGCAGLFRLYNFWIPVFIIYFPQFSSEQNQQNEQSKTWVKSALFESWLKLNSLPSKSEFRVTFQSHHMIFQNKKRLVRARAHSSLWKNFALDTKIVGLALVSTNPTKIYLSHFIERFSWYFNKLRDRSTKWQNRLQVILIIYSSKSSFVYFAFCNERLLLYFLRNIYCQEFLLNFSKIFLIL